MADPVIPAEADLPLAPNGEVKAYDRLGAQITVPKDKVGELYGMGGRVARKQEVTAQQLQDDYAKHSTVEKAAGLLTPALPAPAQAYLRGAGIAPMPPELEAYRAGASQAFTGGTEALLTKEGVELAAGKQAAHAFGQNQLALKQAHEGMYQGGEVAGFIGGAIAGGAGAGLGAAGKAVPGLGISALGGVAEAGAARVLAPIAAKGAIGRALATGGSLAARGAVEGALYSGAAQITEDQLGDKDVVADKVFAAMGTGALYGAAGGAVLGAGGSLAASGARGVRSSIGRALTRGEGAAADAAAGIERSGIEAVGDAAARVETGAVDEAARAVGIKPDAEVGALRKMLQGEGDEVARSGANRLAFDSLGATKTVAKKINEKVPGGTEAVGDYVNRRILKTAGEDATLVGTIRGGRADELLPVIQADGAVIGSGIGDIVKATPVRVGADELIAKAMKTHAEMLADPTRIQGAEAFRNQVGHTFEAFSNGGKLTNGTMDLSEMYYARAKMEGVAHEMKRSNGAAGDAFKEWLREVDAHLVDKIDDAAKALGDTGKREELMGLKREYQLNKAAEKAATEGTDRISGNNAFGIREGIGGMVGLATGHPLAAIGAALAGKVARERGSAAGAYLLTKMADMKVLSRALAAVDDQVGRAAKGAITAPTARPLPEPPSTVPLRDRATAVLNHSAEVTANPERLADRIAAHTDPLQANAPNLAAGLGARIVSAYAMLNSKIPVHADPDPFDPHPAARLSDAQAATVVRYGAYIERPMRFFEEVEHGKITHEGVDMARILLPGMFAELQQRTVEGLADLMARGQRPPFAQRQRLGILLDIPAVPSQRPDHMLLLQANVSATKPAAQTPGAQAPKRPIATKSQPGTLDRLEGR